MLDFCGFDAVNGVDSGRKPLREHKIERGENLALETKLNFCSCSGD